MKQIGHHQQGIGTFELGVIVVYHPEELVKRVKLHELIAGVLKNLPTRHLLECKFQHAIRATIAVVIGIAQEIAAAVQKGEIHPPGIHPDAAKRALELMGKAGDPTFDLVPQAQNIPVSMTPDNNRFIGKAVNFFYINMLAIPASQDSATTGAAQIYCEEINGCRHG